MIDIKAEDKLQELLGRHPSLLDKFRNDATVYAWFKQYSLGRCTLEELLVGTICWLADEKKKLFDEVVEMHQRYGSNK